MMFWNVENFFDWRNDSTTVSDTEFSAAGERHWTWKRFQAKANAFAKALLWVSADTGSLPDIVGLAEVENSFVLRQVLTKTLLRKLDYKYVHYDSPDRRGIDVALLYRTSVLELLDSKPCHLYADTGVPGASGAPGVSGTPGAAADSVMSTRDILLCVFRDKRGVIPGSTGNLPEIENSLPFGGGCDGKFAVLVNHHPSKYGGAAESDSRRRLALQRLRFLTDSLAEEGIDRIIAGGDFNKDLQGDSSVYYGKSDKDVNWGQPIPEGTFDGYNVTLVSPLHTMESDDPVPTARNADSPYHEGQYVLTVDGFLVSDNVSVVSAGVVDTGFAYSDHNPVEMCFILE